MNRILFFALFALAGCYGTGAGDPCTPEEVPAGGFDSRETYIERSSTDCVSRVCIVSGLAGDPTPGCTTGCPTEEDIAAHVYCSCRCDDLTPGGPCACPDGFSCADLGEESYCVRDEI